VKLQALVRGNIVRRQAAETLRCMHALVRVQARARACRAILSQHTVSHPVCDHHRPALASFTCKFRSGKCCISYGSWIFIAGTADAGEVRTGGSRRCAQARPFRFSKGESVLSFNNNSFAWMPVTPNSGRVICTGELVQDNGQ
jgi:hypothetical protein